jgi:hypothetical protein
MLRARFAKLCADDTNPSPTRLYAVTRARGPGPSAEGAAVPGGTLAPECLTRCGWARGFCSSQRSCPGCPGARDAVGRAMRQGACQRARRELHTRARASRFVRNRTSSSVTWLPSWRRRAVKSPPWAYQVCPMVHGYACLWSLLHARMQRERGPGTNNAAPRPRQEEKARHRVHCPAAGMSSGVELSRGGWTSKPISPFTQAIPPFTLVAGRRTVDGKKNGQISFFKVLEERN